MFIFTKIHMFVEKTVKNQLYLKPCAVNFFWGLLIHDVKISKIMLLFILASRFFPLKRVKLI